MVLLLSIPAITQSLTATTADGRQVLLKPDGTWEFTKDQPETASYSEKQRSILQAAIASLRNLSDATTFGITSRDYRTKLANSKATIEDAVNVLPSGDIRSQITAIWALHIKAAQWWDTLSTTRTLGLSQSERDELKKDLPKIAFTSPDRVSREEILSACWADALERLQSLIKLTDRLR